MTGFLAPRGAPPVLQNLAPSQLAIDQAYQRSIDQAGRRLIGEIARAWDWSLCQPLVVARRPDMSLYVIDGQHRLEAARTRGDIPWLPCVVVDHPTPTTEAAAFVSLNARRRPLTPMALFRADIASGNPAAIELMALIEGAGLRLTGIADASGWKPGWINNIVGLSKCHRRHGAAITRTALECLARGFAGEVLSNCGTLWSGIWPTVVAGGGDRFSRELFVLVLAGADQAQWIRDIVTYSAEQAVARQAAAAAVMTRAYLEAEGGE